MLNLRVFSGSDQYYLDLFEDDPVNLTRQFSDVQLNKPSGSFSQTFRVPATENNATFFTNIHEVNSVGDFNPKVKSKAELEYNGIPLARGFIQLKAIYIEERVPEYEVVLFGETADLFREIGDSKLSDLDLSSYNHTLNSTNVVATDGVLSGDIRYGLVDKGQGWHYDGSGITDLNNEALVSGDFTPFIRVKALIDTIFSEAGSTYESTFIDSSYFANLYMLLYNGNLYPKTTSDPEEIAFNVGLSSDENVTASGFHQFDNFSDSGNFFDLGNDFTIGVDDYWTAPYSGTFTFQFWVSGTNNEANFSEEIAFRVTRNNITIFSPTSIEVDGGEDFNFTWTINVTAAAGDEVRCGVIIEDTPTIDITFNSTAAPDTTNGTGWALVAATTPYDDVTVAVSENVPDIKQKDFLGGLQKMFNLVFVPDNVNPTKMYIEPFQDYVYSGDVLDWTEKIDYSKTVTLKPTADIQKREYKWQYDEGKDLLSQYFASNAGDGLYGELHLEDTENDFATGKEEVKVPFAPFPCAYIAGSDTVIHKVYDNSGVRVQDPKVRIAYYGGVFDCAEYNRISTSTGNELSRTTYHFFGHYSDPRAGVDAEDLNFNVESPLHEIDGQPYNNLYNKFWRDYVNEYYSVEARKMTAFFKLDVADFYSVKFADRIFIKDSYWRILKINEFQPNKDELTEVELIKELKTPRACEHIPTGISGNEVVFEDSSGAETDGSEECCNLFGYTWSSALSKCLISQAPNSGFNPVNPQFRVNDARRSLIQGNPTFEAGTINSVVSGSRISTGVDNSFSTLVGRNIDVGDSLGSVQAFGDDVEVFGKGIHLGGGRFSESRGEKQVGTIILSASGSFDSLPSAEVLTLTPHITIPSGGHIAFNLGVLISEEGTINVIDSGQYIQCMALVKNDAGTYSASGVNVVDEEGDHAADITVSLDVSNDDIRVEVTNDTADITNAVRVVARMDYVLTRQ